MFIDYMVDIQAVFELVGDNPPTALIVGGILFLLIGVVLHTAQEGSGGLPIILGILLIALGVLLHLQWLDTR